MMELIINVLFWGKDENRIFNTRLCWISLKNFCEYAGAKGLNIQPFLFDFSEENALFPDEMHIPYSNDEYKRSEKINKVIDFHKDYDGFFGIMDSDLIIDPRDYDKFISFIKSFKGDEYYVFKLNYLKTTRGVDFENNDVDFGNLDSFTIYYEPDLGALFFMQNKAMQHNKFDESFIVWGGEDNELSYRLQDQEFRKVVSPVNPYHLPHQHALKESEVEQYRKQCESLTEGINKHVVKKRNAGYSSD